MRATFSLENPPSGAIYWNLTICSRSPAPDCRTAPYSPTVDLPAPIEVPDASSAFLNTLWIVYSDGREVPYTDFASVVEIYDGRHYEYDFSARTLRETAAPPPREPELFAANFRLADKKGVEAWFLRLIIPWGPAMDSDWGDPDTTFRFEFMVPFGMPKDALFDVYLWVATEIPGEAKLVFQGKMELLKYPSGTVHKVGAKVGFPWVWTGVAGALVALAFLTRRS